MPHQDFSKAVQPRMAYLRHPPPRSELRILFLFLFPAGPDVCPPCLRQSFAPLHTPSRANGAFTMYPPRLRHSQPFLPHPLENRLPPIRRNTHEYCRPPRIPQAALSTGPRSAAHKRRLPVPGAAVSASAQSRALVGRPCSQLQFVIKVH
jgi:hypothetical protein